MAAMTDRSRSPGCHRYLRSIRTVVQFIFSDLRANSRAWWLVNEDGEVDLCPVDPGDDPELQICTTLQTMTRVWMGDLSIDTVLRSGALTIVGPRDLRRCLGGWLRLSPYAPVADARRAPHQARGRPA
jgi:hypothetical protein